MRKFVRIERQLGIEVVDRTRDRVAIDVAACAERRELVTVVADAQVDLANQRAQIVPAHVVELDALARGQAEAAVGVSICRRVERDPLRRRQLARGNLDPHHEDEIAVLLAALVALALFVDAEMLRDFFRVLADRVGLARAERVYFRAHRMPAFVR